MVCQDMGLTIIAIDMVTEQSWNNDIDNKTDSCTLTLININFSHQLDVYFCRKNIFISIN